MDLFDYSNEEKALESAPLAERLRPESLQDFVGQQHLLRSQSVLGRFLRGQNLLPNLIFWGPPGTGKTTLARILSKQGGYFWEPVSAIDTGAKKLKEIGEAARHRKLSQGLPTLLFVDEIHRLNKAQQDVLLPYSERGDFTLLGATTENPGYELNRALLSRCQVLRFEPLGEEDLKKLFEKSFSLQGLSSQTIFTEPAYQQLIHWSSGDGRRAVQLAEGVLQQYLAQAQPQKLELDTLKENLQRNFIAHDKASDLHYDCISAFIKSLRGSDPDASLYYLARMLEAGEDPTFVARRMVILASEDVGNADPQALQIAVAGFDAVEKIGMPEAAINLAQVATYLATAPKSNRSYVGLRKAQETVRETGELEIPFSLRSAQTGFAKSQGYGKGYKYSHDYDNAFIQQNFMPSSLSEKIFYEPSDRGYENKIKKWLEFLKNNRER
ncbi:MAG: replication-associated recombination protein A [Bdellovibrionales bacterium]|nr:replication-associated recombination protein A [Bdellovibrionales bacterium]